jgi:hypothetical protein
VPHFRAFLEMWSDLFLSVSKRLPCNFTLNINEFSNSSKMCIKLSFKPLSKWNRTIDETSDIYSTK